METERNAIFFSTDSADAAGTTPDDVEPF